MVPVKNFGLFLRVAKRVIDSGIKAKFILIGDGPMRAELQNTAADLGLGEKVIFTGFREDVFRLVSILDLFVLCSNSETNPIALIEAMALKRPVVATNVGGVLEIVDNNVNGLLCPSGDEVFLASSITHLLQNMEKARELGDNAYQKVRNAFTLKSMTSKLLDVYDGLVN